MFSYIKLYLAMRNGECVFRKLIMFVCPEYPFLLHALYGTLIVDPYFAHYSTFVAITSTSGKKMNSKNKGSSIFSFHSRENEILSFSQHMIDVLMFS